MIRSGRRPVPVDRRAGAIDPERREPERLRADRVPASSTTRSRCGRPAVAGGRRRAGRRAGCGLKMPAASTDSTPSSCASRPVCADQRLEHRQRAVRQDPARPRRERGQRGGTSGNGASARYASQQRASARPGRDRSPAPPAHSRAHARSPRRNPAAARRASPSGSTSHVYSSCLVRQSCDSAAPRPGASASASAVTECTSNSVPYASKTSASTANEAGRRRSCGRRVGRVGRCDASRRRDGQKKRGYTCA